jgi:hypothetical protein
MQWPCSALAVAWHLRSRVMESQQFPHATAYDPSLALWHHQHQCTWVLWSHMLPNSDLLAFIHDPTYAYPHPAQSRPSMSSWPSLPTFPASPAAATGSSGSTPPLASLFLVLLPPALPRSRIRPDGSPLHPSFPLEAPVLCFLNLSIHLGAASPSAAAPQRKPTPMQR